MQVRKSCGKSGVAVAMVLAVCAASTTALGQVQQIVGGNVLDANSKVGSGGSNHPVPGYAPINGNDIMTGNVAGLKYFHGSEPIRSQYEFGGTLGSSSLNNFVRTSAGDGPGAYSSGLGTVYYNPASTVSRGTTGFYPGSINGGYDARYVPQSSLSPTSTGAAAGLSRDPMAVGLPYRAYDRSDPTGTNSLEVRQDQPGGVISSPLFGLRQVNEATPKSEAIDGAVKTGTTEKKTPDTGDTNDTTPKSGVNTTPEQSAGDAARVDANVGVKGVDASRNEMRISQTYRTLLDQLREEQAKAAAEKLKGAGGAVEVAANATNVNSAESRLTKMEVDPVTGELRPVRSADELAKKGYQTSNPALPGYVTRMSAETLESEPTDKLQAGKKVKALDTLTDKSEPNLDPAIMGRELPFNALMTRAEGYLHEGRYFEAADTYQIALTAQPDNALALVGRAHAELGAGLYDSAAFDLKYLFKKKPEMMAVHYDFSKFYPTKRDDFLVKDLFPLTQKEDGGNMASFLYCYLCYQTGREQEMRKEFVRWGNRDWKDSWYEVTRRGWWGD